MKRRWTWARRLTAAAFLALLVLGAQPWFPWFRGSTTATTLFDAVPFSDPLAALEVWLASGGLETTLLVGALILLFIGLLLGPVFCGWVCPLGLILDLNDEIRRRLQRLPGLRIPWDVRYLVLGLALGLSLTVGLPAFQTVSPINFVSWLAVFHLENAIDACWPMLLALGFLVILEYVAPRIFCRSLCPLGALYSFVGRFAILGIRVSGKAACPGSCRQCTVYCPMGIEVREEIVEERKRSVDSLECTRCGECVDRCPKGRLRLGFRSEDISEGISESS